MEFWTSRGRPPATIPNRINKIITREFVRSGGQGRILIMRHPAPGFFPVCILVAGALGLGSCQSLHNSLDPLTGRVPMQEASGKPALLPAMVPVSRGTKEDYSALETDNARLRNQLADALKENAKLKKDLADAIDDKALLKDLAAKKQR
jgi:hypothetical protein